MSFVPIDTVIARVQTVIPTASTQDKFIWQEWTWMALQDLGLSDEDIRTCVIYPHDGIAKKPDDCKHIIELALFDSTGNELKHKYRTGGKRIYTDKRLFPYETENGDETTTPTNVPVDVSDDRYNIILGTNGSHVNYITLRYFTYPIDEKTKLPLIREDEVMAIIYFIRYMWALRKNDNQSEIQMNQASWFRESDRVRAKKKMDSWTPEKAKSMQRWWMSMIPGKLEEY